MATYLLPHNRPNSDSSGYTLLELSIVLMVLSLVAGFVMPLITQETIRARNRQMSEKMAALEKALADYRIKNDRLPCPAGFADSVSSADFAVSAGSAGSCTAASAGACAGSNPVLCRPAANVVSGVVPVRTLGLADDAMIDAWGRRILYVADERMTASGAFTTYKPQSATGAIEVRDESSSARSTSAIAVLLSHGPNGHGAYTRAGSRISESVTNTMELANCKCTNAAASGTFDNVFYQRAGAAVSNHAANTFDDVARYYTRGSFLSPGDKTVPE